METRRRNKMDAEAPKFKCDGCGETSSLPDDSFEGDVVCPYCLSIYEIDIYYRLMGIGTDNPVKALEHVVVTPKFINRSA